MLFWFDCLFLNFARIVMGTPNNWLATLSIVLSTFVGTMLYRQELLISSFYNIKLRIPNFLTTCPLYCHTVISFVSLIKKNIFLEIQGVHFFLFLVLFALLCRLALVWIFSNNTPISLEFVKNGSLQSNRTCSLLCLCVGRLVFVVLFETIGMPTTVYCLPSMRICPLWIRIWLAGAGSTYASSSAFSSSLSLSG